MKPYFVTNAAPVAFTRIFLALLLVCAGFGLSACNEPEVVVEETEEAAYKRAKRMEDEGRLDDALEAYVSVIDKRKMAPESHLEAGKLYLAHVEDPISAIYHFRQYLQFKPDSKQAPYVKQLIDTAKKNFISELPGKPFEGNYERVELLDIIEQQKDNNRALQQEVAILRQQLQSLNERAATAPTVTYNMPQPRQQANATQPRATEPSTQQQQPQPSQPATNNVPATYTVQSGDTLSSISKRFYGTEARWRDIYNANQDRMSSPNALKLGQELRLPR